MLIEAAGLPEECGVDAKAGRHENQFVAASGSGADVCRSNRRAAIHIHPPKWKPADTSVNNFKVRIKRGVTQAFQIVRSRRKRDDDREQDFFKDKMKIGEPNTTAS
jgi:hypothetical protein